MCPGVSLAGAATSIIFVATNPVFCPDKCMAVATRVLSQQKCVCRGTRFVATCLLLSRQKRVCRDTYLTQQNSCRDKHNFVATKVLSRPEYFCRDRRRVLSRQTRVCRDKRVFVATKLLSRQNIILVAAPASDTGVVLTGWL